MDNQQTQARVAQVEAALEAIESLPDIAARNTAITALQGLLELYGEGLSRIVASVARHDGAAANLNAFTEDELIAHLLLLHDLHPGDLSARVQQALEEVRPYLASHGGNVELLGVESGVVHLRLQGSCKGCPSSALTLQSAIEEAIQKTAPDVVRIEAEGVTQPAPTAGFIPLTALNGKLNGTLSANGHPHGHSSSER